MNFISQKTDSNTKQAKKQKQRKLKQRNHETVGYEVRKNITKRNVGLNQANGQNVGLIRP